MLVKSVIQYPWYPADEPAMVPSPWTGLFLNKGVIQTDVIPIPSR